MAAHSVYDCSPFILTRALIHQQKSRDPDRLKRGETHLQYVHVYVFTHKHTHTHTHQGEGSLFVDPRGRGSVRSQAADSAFENLRIRGKRERGGEGGMDR